MPAHYRWPRWSCSLPQGVTERTQTERAESIALPDRLVEELKAYRKEHARLCLGLGLGKVDIVFPALAQWRAD